MPRPPARVNAASMPRGKRTASSVAFVCLSDIDAVDSDCEAVPANRLSGKRQHPLEHGDADRQVTIEIKESSEKIGRLYGHELGHGQLRGRLNAVKTDRNAI